MLYTDDIFCVRQLNGFRRSARSKCSPIDLYMRVGTYKISYEMGKKKKNEIFSRGVEFNGRGSRVVVAHIILLLLLTFTLAGPKVCLYILYTHVTRQRCGVRFIREKKRCDGRK